MSSVSPSRPSSTSLAVIGVAAAVVVAVIVAVLAWLISGGYFAALGRWMHTSDVGTALRYLLESLALLVCVLLSTAALIYIQRKIWGAVQLRRGPNVVGPWGILQPFADFFKFILKEPIIPASANKAVFLLAPVVSVVLAFAAWAVIPVSDGWVVADINVGLLYLFAVSSLGVYGVIMAGWASNSKYALLSALRAAAQMVSYEVSIGFVIVTVVLCAGSVNLSDIVRAQDTRFGFFGWYWLPLFPMFIVFFISALAETNWPPFDLTEAELELVAGYTVEYSASLFLLQFLTELVALLTDGIVGCSPVPRRMALAASISAVYVDTGGYLVLDQVLGGRVLLFDGHSLCPALSLRSVDAPGLEGVPADFSSNGGGRGRSARNDRSRGEPLRPIALREESQWLSGLPIQPSLCSWQSSLAHSRCLSAICSSSKATLNYPHEKRP